MNISQDKINEHIKSYINDVYDYHDDVNHHKIVESVLTSLSKLTESDKNFSTALKEIIAKSSSEDKEIFKDFLIYMKEI